MMKMKRLISAVFIFMATGLAAGAQLVERSYVTTDRHIYVAGEDIFYSLFCFDAMSGVLSDFSSIAYVELVSTEGSAAHAKVALQEGRGAGRMRIPSDLPGGNYRLIAYTAQNRNECTMDYFQSSRIISIFNTLSTNRLKETVLMSGQPVANNADSIQDGAFGEDNADTGAAAPLLSIQMKGDSLMLRNMSSELLDFSLSMSIKDGIRNPLSPGLDDYMASFSDLQKKEHQFRQVCIPEYEGEILSVKVSPSYSGAQAFLSSPGTRTDIYSSLVDSTGLVSFFTGNVYGDRDLVFELVSPTVEENFSYEVLSPYIHPELAEENITGLKISESYRNDLIRRSIYMQIGRHFGIDTYTDSLSVRPDLLFSGVKKVVYKMDDYTRFPTMRETIIEYVRELSVRRQEGNYIIKVSPTKENMFSNSLKSGNALILVDGVIISDHSLVLDMDPGLLKRIDIYPYDVSTGSYVASGVVNFISYKSDMAGCRLPSRARILGFQGTTIPVSIGSGEKDNLMPDYRYTRLWQPLMKLAPGQEISLPLGKLPDEKFIVEAEGLCGKEAFSFVGTVFPEQG